MPEELHGNMEQCRQTHAQPRRWAAAAEGFTKTKNAAFIVGAGAVLVVVAGILLLKHPWVQGQPAKEPCPEGESCNVRVRQYKQSVVSDIPDLSPSWFGETPSPSPTHSPATREGSPTPTATQATTLASVSPLQSANCRFGPGVVYTITTSFAQGRTLAVIGRNEASTWWQVAIPESQRVCWIAASVVEASGDLSVVPVVNSPPTPTPTVPPPPREPPAPVQGCWISFPKPPSPRCVYPCPTDSQNGGPCTP